MIARQSARPAHLAAGGPPRRPWPCVILAYRARAQFRQLYSSREYVCTVLVNIVQSVAQYGTFLESDQFFECARNVVPQCVKVLQRALQLNCSPTSQFESDHDQRFQYSGQRVRRDDYVQAPANVANRIALSRILPQLQPQRIAVPAVQCIVKQLCLSRREPVRRVVLISQRFEAAVT